MRQAGEDARIAADATCVLGEGNVAHIMGAVLNAPVLADGLSADRRRQDGVADEPGRLAGRPPEPGRGGAGKNIASDTNDGADMIGPFGTGQAIAWREHLDQPQFVAGMAVFVG